MQARQVIFVVFGGVERRKTHKLRNLQMGSKELVDRHLERFQLNRFDPDLQVSNHENLIEFVLFGEACCIERSKAREPVLKVSFLVLNMRE